MKRTPFLTSTVLTAVFCLVIVALSGAALFVFLSREKEQVLQNAFRQTDNLSRAFQEHSLRTVENVRQVLESLKEIYEKRGGGVIDTFEEAANASVARYAIRSREAQGTLFNLLSIADENGDLVLSSQRPFRALNVFERPFFRAHLSGVQEFIVGEPILGRATGKWFIPMSLPVEKPDGSFGGVILASVDPFYFSLFYRQVRLGPKGFVLFSGPTGKVLTGTVQDGDPPFGKSIAESNLFRSMMSREEGSLTCFGLPDGEKRIISYRKVAPYPLFISAGMSLDEILSPYYRRRTAAVLAAASFTLFVALFFAAAYSAFSRERKEEERFRNFFEQSSVGFAIVSPEGEWIHFNDKLCEITGYPREELLERPWRDLTPPEELVGEMKVMAKAIAGHWEDVFIEKRYVRRNGTLVDVDVSTKIIWKNDGSLRYFASMVQDVSERKRSERLLAKRAEELELHREAIIESMAMLAEYRDRGTGNHIRRTKEYVKLLLERSGSAALFPEKDLPLVWQSAVLHDIGKVGIPDAILLKREPLTEEEFEIIRSHPLIGSEVLRRAEERLGSASFITYSRQITEYHHEKWDGTGYPHGLGGEDIPLLARITAIADAYDALISRRPYKEPVSHEEAVEAIRAGAGTHFDPRLVEVFLRCSNEFREIISRIPEENMPPDPLQESRSDT
jgi:PAS domain S-box-containing protein